MDLVALATRLKSGESSLGTIDAEINSYKELYALPPPENDEEFAEWLQRRESLAGAINQLASTLRSEDTEQGIVSLGRVLTSAASLLETGTRLQAWASVGERLARIKAYESALDWFDAADGIYDELTNTDKKYPLQNVLFKPECLEALNRYQDLEQFAQRLIETLGEAAPFYKHLGAAKGALGRHPEAIKAFNRALELFDQVEPGKNVDGERADVYYRLGASARSAGDYEGALQAFESARSFALQAKNRVLAAFALSEQGITWNQVGDELRGRKLLVAAAAEADALGRAIDAARWRAAPPPPDTPHCA